MDSLVDRAPAPGVLRPAARDRVNAYWRLASAALTLHLFVMLHVLDSIATRAMSAALMMAAGTAAFRGFPARLGARGRGGLALLVGLPALASGVGVTRVGLGRTVISELTGLVSLALAGVGLTVLGVALLLRSVRRR